MIKYWKLLCAVLVSLCVASCSDDVPEPKEPRYKHTVIVYMAADNSLSADSNTDIDEVGIGQDSRGVSGGGVS